MFWSIEAFTQHLCTERLGVTKMTQSRSFFWKQLTSNEQDRHTLGQLVTRHPWGRNLGSNQWTALDWAPEFLGCYQDSYIILSYVCNPGKVVSLSSCRSSLSVSCQVWTTLLLRLCLVWNWLWTWPAHLVWRAEYVQAIHKLLYPISR